MIIRIPGSLKLRCDSYNCGRELVLASGHNAAYISDDKVANLADSQGWQVAPVTKCHECREKEDGI